MSEVLPKAGLRRVFAVVLVLLVFVAGLGSVELTESAPPGWGVVTSLLPAVVG